MQPELSFLSASLAIASPPCLVARNAEPRAVRLYAAKDGVSMSLRTVGLSSIYSDWVCERATCVYADRDCIEVPGIHANAITAEVVDGQSIRNDSLCQAVSGAVRHLRCSCGDLKSSITAGTDRPSPWPAFILARTAIHLLVKAFFDCKKALVVAGSHVSYFTTPRYAPRFAA